MGDLGLAAELRWRGIRDERVLEAVGSLSRSDFIPRRLQAEATADHPVPIGHGQTISQPYIVAYMSQELRLTGGERVLEIGTGSAYQTAVLSHLAQEVYSVEIIPQLARQAAARLAVLGFRNIHLREADGTRGWADAAPFDAILVTAAPHRVPPALIAQLAPGGRLIAPVGGEEELQELVRITKDASGKLEVEQLLPVRFVPMTAAHYAQ